MGPVRFTAAGTAAAAPRAVPTANEPLESAAGIGRDTLAAGAGAVLGRAAVGGAMLGRAGCGGGTACGREVDVESVGGAVGREPAWNGCEPDAGIARGTAAAGIDGRAGRLRAMLSWAARSARNTSFARRWSSADMRPNRAGWNVFAS